MKSYKIHLIRHGLTEANEKGWYLGLTDLPLSPAGLKDLLQKKERAVYPSATRFYTSPLMRCKQTLATLYPQSQAIEADGLVECDFGDWEGKTAAELQHDDAFRDWIAGKRSEIPDGESAADFQKRVMEEFERIVQDVLRSGDTDTVICTHGGVIMMIMAAYAFPRAEMSAWGTEGGCGFTLRITPSLWMREPVAEAIDYVPLIPEP
ncbi:MAG: phosphoglycerate mutase family protein [Clostridia bacterium]|nr:phosphoglycerate mutase family protein [Clostridia bacterium]